MERSGARHVPLLKHFHVHLVREGDPQLLNHLSQRKWIPISGRVFHINEFIESGFRAYVNSFTSRRSLNYRGEHGKGDSLYARIGRRGAVTIKARWAARLL